MGDAPDEAVEVIEGVEEGTIEEEEGGETLLEDSLDDAEGEEAEAGVEDGGNDPSAPADREEEMLPADG